jgi:ABC-type enterochelin transport system, ATPase component
VIEIQEATIQYGGVYGIRNVTATISAGKVTTLIGPNGAGKSTLLSAIGRMQSLDAGTVKIGGLDVGRTDSNELAKKVAVLKQSNAINVRITVQELVEFGRFPHARGRLTAADRVRVDAAIDYLDLHPFRGTYLDQLSGGQRQRAFIAMVLAQDTEYVLLDEPLNHLDMKHSVQTMTTLRRLVDDLGKTVVLVLHDINFASVYSDDIIAMKDGAIVHTGPAAAMMEQEVLREVYDFEIPVHVIGGNRIGVYYA